MAHAIESFDDPLLGPYRNLKDKELARDGQRFIAESENVVRRLLASGMGVESVLLARRKETAIAPLVPAHASLLIATDQVIERIIGFEFHSGVLACGIRPKSPPLESIIPEPPAPVLLAVCQEITNTENLGSIIRVCAALGADGLVLGEHCCDPYFRQSVRVSMGAVFSLPMVRSSDLLADLDRLGKLGVKRWAAVLDKSADSLGQGAAPNRLAVVFGNEAQGLDERTIGACDKRVTIPMRRQTDSLNVAVAVAVFLHSLARNC